MEVDPLMQDASHDGHCGVPILVAVAAEVVEENIVGGVNHWLQHLGDINRQHSLPFFRATIYPEEGVIPICQPLLIMGMLYEPFAGAVNPTPFQRSEGLPINLGSRQKQSVENGRGLGIRVCGQRYRLGHRGYEREDLFRICRGRRCGVGVPELRAVRICVVANSSDDQVLSGIPQPGCLRLKTEGAMLGCELVPGRGDCIHFLRIRWLHGHNSARRGRLALGQGGQT